MYRLARSGCQLACERMFGKQALRRAAAKRRRTDRTGATGASRTSAARPTTQGLSTEGLITAAGLTGVAAALFQKFQEEQEERSGRSATSTPLFDASLHLFGNDVPLLLADSAVPEYTAAMSDEFHRRIVGSVPEVADVTAFDYQDPRPLVFEPCEVGHPKDVDISRMCQNCLRCVPSGERLHPKCSACNTNYRLKVRYCDSKCQNEHWSNHKETCASRFDRRIQAAIEKLCRDQGVDPTMIKVVTAQPTQLMESRRLAKFFLLASASPVLCSEMGLLRSWLFNPFNLLLCSSASPVLVRTSLQLFQTWLTSPSPY